MQKHIFLSVNLLFSTLIGMRPQKFSNPQLTTAHHVYCNCILLAFGSFVCSQVYRVFKIETYLEATNNLGVTLLYFSCLMKVLVSRSHKVDDLIRFVTEYEADIMQGKLKTYFLAFVGYNNKLNAALMFVGGFTITSFFLNVELEKFLNVEGLNATEHRFLFSASMPFDEQEHYKLTLAIHVVVAVVASSLITSIDMLLYSLMIFAYAQITVLQRGFTDLKKTAGESAMEMQISEDEAVGDVLKKYIVMHQGLIWYVDTLNKSIRYLMLMDSAIASTQIAMVGFQIMTNFKQFFVVVYLLAMLLQLSCCYWLANEILIESSKIALSIWESEWYSFDSTIKKSLLFVIMRSQTPLKLTIGKFTVMSTNSLISIVKASYSYVMLLHRMYTRD